MSNISTPAPPALKLCRILTPVDFSDRCRHAAQYAACLARQFHCELILLHAVAPVGVAFSAPEGAAYSGAMDLILDRVADCTSMLETFLAEELRDVATRRVVLENSPGIAILEYASDRDCDLIVMPTHGYGALHRLMTGSVTVDVLHHAHCPVWTGPHYETEPKPAAEAFRNVVCALDLAPESRAVLAWAAGFAHEFGATLHIVHALPTSTVRFDPDWRAHVTHEARTRIAELQHDLFAPGEIRFPLGDAPAAITAAAREVDAGLLVIGRGPKAYGIIREASCPVVAV